MESSIYRSYKVKLKPNKKQATRFFQMAGIARYSYNWALARQKENKEQGKKMLPDSKLRKEFNVLKKARELKWITEVSADVSKIAIMDSCNSYVRFIKGYARYPKFKSKKRSKPSFSQDSVKMKVTKTHIRLEKIAKNRKTNKEKLNWIKLGEANYIPFGENIVYSNPRITFDGIDWWLSIGVQSELNYYHKYTNGVGVDLGVKDQAITSDNEVWGNINKTEHMRKLEKKRKRLQRRVSRKYRMNKDGDKFVKTKNIEKLEKQIRKLYRKQSNTRKTYLHQITTKITDRKPKFVVLEDLDVRRMMKNKGLAKKIAEQNFYEFRRIMEYKCKWNEIEFILADRYFPSSKSCSQCGFTKKDLKLSDRVYNCNNCGHNVDRDLNAALNLKAYGERYMESIA